MITNTKSGRRLYGRGWLGLIPLVGGFVGLGLIILGSFKYKDKKLILIGFAAFLFTIVIYSSLFYYTGYSDAGGKQFTQTTQDFLNSLVKDLEFYKQQNDLYPDSLEQLLPNNKLAWINDPLLSRKPTTKNTRFNYKRNGDTYILFSSGIDKIPNTKDDIFPTVKLNGNQKGPSNTY